MCMWVRRIKASASASETLCAREREREKERERERERASERARERESERERERNRDRERERERAAVPHPKLEITPSGWCQWSVQSNKVQHVAPLLIPLPPQLLLRPCRKQKQMAFWRGSKILRELPIKAPDPRASGREVKHAGTVANPQYRFHKNKAKHTPNRTKQHTPRYQVNLGSGSPPASKIGIVLIPT